MIPTRSLIRRVLLCLSLFFTLFCLTSCEHKMVIINDIGEREANEIIVFLASKGIAADKMAATSTNPTAGEGGVKWNISVESEQSTLAMSYLNQNGFPRKQGTTLLDLFAKAGLMSSEKEETIRYQAGLAEQIANMIRKIDGVIDADVQISFPPVETGAIGPAAAQAQPKKITAAVYVKHQGVLDDPNSHLVTKIKRLVSGSVTGLDVNDVTVISDRSRLTDISLTPSAEPLEPKAKEYVSIWSIVMSKSSAARFRFIFFLLIVCTILFAAVMGWIVWKFYPLMKKKGGLRALLNPIPIEENEPPRVQPEEKKQ